MNIAVMLAPATFLASPTPPRGWNSYDSYTMNVNETEFLDNCAALAHETSWYLDRVFWVCQFLEMY